MIEKSFPLVIEEAAVEEVDMVAEVVVEEEDEVDTIVDQGRTRMRN